MEPSVPQSAHELIYYAELWTVDSFYHMYTFPEGRSSRKWQPEGACKMPSCRLTCGDIQQNVFKWAWVLIVWETSPLRFDWAVVRCAHVLINSSNTRELERVNVHIIVLGQEKRIVFLVRKKVWSGSMVRLCLFVWVCFLFLFTFFC